MAGTTQVFLKSIIISLVLPEISSWTVSTNSVLQEEHNYIENDNKRKISGALAALKRMKR